MKCIMWNSFALLITVFISESSGEYVWCLVCETRAYSPTGKYDDVHTLKCIYGYGKGDLSYTRVTETDPYVCYSLLRHTDSGSYWIERDSKRINETNIDASNWDVNQVWRELRVCKTDYCNDNSYAEVFGLPKNRSDLENPPESLQCGATKEESTLSLLLIIFVTTTAFL